jgi:alginate O-acetyltransferase complex protein AlgI
MTFISLAYAVFLMTIVAMYWSAQWPQLRLWTLVYTSLGFFVTWGLHYFAPDWAMPWVGVGPWITVTYGVFSVILAAMYWSAHQASLRFWTLLFAGLVFYASLQVQYVPLMLVGTWVTYRLGQAIALPPDWRNEDWEFAQQDWNNRRLKLLIFGIVLNVLLLLGFKYVPFLFATLGWQESANWTKTHLIAPLGISFFCFECIAYLVDVYRGAPAAQEFLKFAAYKLFFPKLISGPITRYQTLAAQFQTPVFPSPERVAEGLWLIAGGAVKKGLLADNLGVLVDLSFQNVSRAGSGDLWLATIAYGLQLYLDFSGYVDMARGSAVLLGLSLPPNFDSPYFSTSIADFWRRWHITLGDWLRNYLYFPLGGSRRGLQRTCVNLVVVMAIAGLWHGAAWGFVVWGVLHGVALVVHRLMDEWSNRVAGVKLFWQSWPGQGVGWLCTQWMVFSTWIFFRLPDLKDSSIVLQRLVGHTADAQFTQKVYVEALGLEPQQLGALLWLLAGVMGMAYGLRKGLHLQLNWYIKLLLVPICFFAVWMLAPQGALPYIYFDF